MTARLHLAAARQAPDPEPEDESIRVVLADDRSRVRRSLRLLLNGEDDVHVVADACDVGSVMHHVHGYVPHVIVLDLQMPGGSSIEAIRRLRERVPDSEIVVLTTEHSPAYARRVLDAGALGLVLQDRADVELPEAVRRAAQGEEYVSPPVAAGLDAVRRTADDDGLSPRETEVLQLIALGYTSTEIANQVHLSRRTVETHRAKIHRKLGLTTRAELVQAALQRHLIGA